MLEIQGFMDQITPSIDEIDTVWKAPVKDIKKMIANVLKEMDINNYTFYVKWLTNGIKSQLPFLVNYENSLNFVTNNRGFREIIDYLHDKGIKVSAAFQFGMYEVEGWGRDWVWGEWDQRPYAGI